MHRYTNGNLDIIDSKVAWFIARDRFHLLRVNESWIGYQWLRLRCYIRGLRKW